MRLKTFPQLKADGHPYCRVHTMRLVRDGKFPSPIRIGQNRVAWDADEIDAHYRRLAEQRATKPAQ